MLWFAAFIHLPLIAVVRLNVIGRGTMSDTPDTAVLRFRQFKPFGTSKPAFNANPDLLTETVSGLVR